MSKHCKRASRMAVRQYLATGISGAALVGVGVLLSSAQEESATVTAEVQLVSNETLLAQDESQSDPWFFGSGGSNSSSAGLGAVTQVTAMRPAIGPGGWLIGDGLDALDLDPDCTVNCRGGSGGLLSGNGGDGAFGGVGGSGGYFFGDGGDGGDGVDAFTDDEGVRVAAVAGGAGGNGGFL
ncbi:MAG: hypothetical protein WA965_19460, partial [Mycobacterium sp.]